MKLKSFGCSFIFGTDLADSNDGGTQLEITASPSTWPALVAQRHNFDYECYASAGIGNLQILERVLAHAQSEPAIFVINWTWIDRFDYVHAKDDSWATLRPVDCAPENEYYYKHLHSQYRDKFQTLTAIKTAQDSLTQQGHTVIMTYMDRLMFETEWHSGPAIEYLQQAIQPYMFTFEGRTFLEWAQDKKMPVSQNWHPLESAHASAADYVINQGLL
jgi:hypothetical protein